MSDVLTTTCARGCTRQGKHATDCPDHRTCAGCEPRQVEQGTLCARCISSLRRDIATAPALVRWLRELVEPGAPGQDGRIRGSRTPPLPLSAHAVAAADDLHAQLVSWVLLIIEEHPARLHGPSWVGTLSTTGGKRLVVADVDDLGYPHRLGYGRPAWQARSYEPPRPAGLTSNSDATAGVCRWLLRHLDWAVGQDWAHVMVAELTGTTATFLARWPQEARARYVDDLPCPACDRISLIYYPVTYEQGTVLVQCEHHDCGERVDEDKWEWYAQVVAEAKTSA